MSRSERDAQGERFPAWAIHLARETQVDLEDWSRRYQPFDHRRFPAIALTTAVHLPDLPRSARAVAAQVALWIIAFDEIVDTRWESTDQLHTRLTAYREIVHGVAQAPLEPGDELASALVEIRQRLCAYRSFDTVATHWESSFGQMVNGIVWQRALGRLVMTSSDPKQDTLPAYETLMAIALHSIGVPFYLASCFIMYDDPAIAGRLPILARIGEECARAIRLANDLRTWEREEDEQTLNALMVVEREIEWIPLGLSQWDYRSIAIRLLAERQSTLIRMTHTLLAASPAPRGAPELGIARLVEFVTRFYAEHDYDTSDTRG